MIHLIPIEPLNDVHALLIVDAFNRLFVKDGGCADGYGYGSGKDGYGVADGDGGYGVGNGGGVDEDCDSFGYGSDGGSDGVIPEEWQVK